MIVKICGLTNLGDAEAALEAGADVLGFVLYSRSPRAIGADQLARIAESLPAEARLVGVFVNETPTTVQRVARQCRLHAVQVHGDEAADGFGDLAVPVWRAVRREGLGWRPAPAQWPAERYVVDAASPLYGGTGEQTDWASAATLARQYRVMLAGGLTPENVAEAIATVQPHGVDVSSGVEASPGRKDLRKVAEFVKRAHAAG